MIWKQLPFRGEIRPLTKFEYVTGLTQAYEENPEAYTREIHAGFKDFFSLIDANMNNMLEIEEHIRWFRVFGLTNNKSDMAAFRVAYNNTDSVPLDVAIDIWLEFRVGTTTTATNDTIDEAIKTASHEEL